MNHQLLKPACMVVGRDSAQYRHLQRQLGSRADFFASTESQCLLELMKSGADVVVILWSSTSRQCAQLIHRNFPRARVILEGNRTSLPGRPEKNGFLSVIEKSQSRSELVRQVEAALEDCELSPEIPPLPESAGIDPGSFIGCLPSIPTVSGDIQRTADHLLGLLLSAVKSGGGGLFLRDLETGEYAPVSVRNLPYQVESLRFAPSSKLVSLLSWQTAPMQFSGAAPDNAVSSFVAQLGCNLILPLVIEGGLHGWFVLSSPDQIGPNEKNILASMGFFAVETLRQSYATRQGRQQAELNTVFLTKVTDALAWIKPDGEMTLVHDAQHLFVVRGAHEQGPFTRLASSALKEAIQEARHGKEGRIRFQQKSTGRILHGKTTCLADGSVLLNLSADQPEPLPSFPPGKEKSSWRTLALSTLAAQLPALISRTDVGLVEEFAGEIKRLLAMKEDEEAPLPSVLDPIGRLFPRLEINDPDNVVKQEAIPAGVAGALLLLVLSLRWRQTDAKAALKVSLKRQPGSALQIQLDLEHAGSAPLEEAGIHALEYVAVEGIRANGEAMAFAQAAFGSRWEIVCRKLSKSSSQLETPEISKSSVIQNVLNVLQGELDSAKKVVNEFHG